MKFICLVVLLSIVHLAFAYRRRQVRKLIKEANTPTIPKVPICIEPGDDAMCISLRDRTIFTRRGIAVVATRKHL